MRIAKNALQYPLNVNKARSNLLTVTFALSGGANKIRRTEKSQLARLSKKHRDAIHLCYSSILTLPFWRWRRQRS